jgi:hypothetical protein
MCEICGEIHCEMESPYEDSVVPNPPTPSVLRVSPWMAVDGVIRGYRIGAFSSDPGILGTLGCLDVFGDKIYGGPDNWKGSSGDVEIDLRGD